jgi:hypothetical protein
MKGKEHHDGKHHKADGGRVKEDVYAGAGSNVEKEAKGAEPDEKESPARKRGGKIDGKMAKHRMDRPGRRSGGACPPGMAEPKKHGGHVREERKHGGHVMKEHERPGRKAGGRVGADKAPLTEAANTTRPRELRMMEDAGREP